MAVVLRSHLHRRRPYRRRGFAFRRIRNSWLKSGQLKGCNRDPLRKCYSSVVVLALSMSETRCR